MEWKAKLLAGLRWVKDAVVDGFNFVFDPPPAAIKWYVLGVLVIAVGGGIIGANLKGTDKRAAAPVYLIPKMPGVVTTTLPPPSASPKDLTPLKLYAPKKPTKTKAKKKACDTVFC
jgi:hypothetical protein